jgi:hypothetical protein
MRILSLPPSSQCLYGCDLTEKEKMKIRAKFISIFTAACMSVFLSLPGFARPSHSPQGQQTSQTQSVQKGETQKVEPSSGKEVGKGGEDIGKGAGKGAESLVLLR